MKKLLSSEGNKLEAFKLTQKEKKKITRIKMNKNNFD